ncbi:MAG: S-layer protein domain-containing protein [Methanothrix sp.]|nr:S-layer protein domain-containing protein [Methanothrix sp.]
MRTPTFINFVMILLSMTTVASATEGVELRSTVAVVEDGATYTWGPQEFAGFGYDADENIGTETLTLTITDGSLDEPMGVVYETTAQQAYFDFEEWGTYWTISFLGEEHFAGYAEDSYDDGYYPYLYDRSEDVNLMAGEQLSKILIDDDQEGTITKDAPLQLAEGYELAIKGIDAYGSVWLELSKDGEVVDSNLIAPSKDGATIADKTYIYTKDLGISRGVAVIAVHFKGPVFHGTETGLQDAAVVDGIWQISDALVSIEEDASFGKMRVATVDPDSMLIFMINEDNRVILSRNREIPLMGDIGIKTADQDEISAEVPLRFYVYKEITDPGTYEIRGSISEVVDGGMTVWDPANFAGFYYDIDDNLGNEKIIMTIYGNALEEPDGVVYTTSGQMKDFDFEEWGKYWTIGFLAEEYFAAYVEGDWAYLYDDSADPNLMAAELLSRVLIDDDEERSITSSAPLKLAEGYELMIKSVDPSGKVSLELQKDGRSVDTGMVEPSKNGATVQDKTYTYNIKMGDAEKIVTIAVHFKNVYVSGDERIATVDGVWQISDDPLDIKVDTKIDRMTIQKVDTEAKIIMMNNEDNKINLYRGTDVPLMGKISIKTADQGVLSAEEPLRFYIYREATAEGKAHTPSQEIALI